MRGKLTYQNQNEEQNKEVVILFTKAQIHELETILFTITRYIQKKKKTSFFPSFPSLLSSLTKFSHSRPSLPASISNLIDKTMHFVINVLPLLSIVRRYLVLHRH